MPETTSSKSLSTQKAGVDRRSLEKPEGCKTTTVETLTDYVLQFYELNIRSLEAVAWPISVIFLVLLLRKSLQEMLPRLRHVEVGPLKLIIASAYAEAQELIETTGTPQTVTTKESTELPDNEPAKSPAEDQTGPEVRASSMTASFHSAQTDPELFYSLLKLAKAVPTAAIVQQWRRIEALLQDIAKSPGYRRNAPVKFMLSGRTRTLSAHQIVNELRHQRLIIEDLSEIIESLRLARNQAIHLPPDELNISREDARKYIVSGEIVLQRLLNAKELLAPPEE